MKFAAQHRFTPEQEAEIVRLYATGQHSQHSLARQFGCSQGTIARILKDKPDMNVAALQRRIAKLETALRFYADAENWRCNGQLDPDSGNFTGGPARAALEGGKDE